MLNRLALNGRAKARAVRMSGVALTKISAKV